MSATTTTPAGWARTALPWSWLASAALTGLLGYLLFAVSDRPEDRTAGGLLLGVAVLGLVAVALTRGGAPNARRSSLAASAVAAVGGVLADLTEAHGAYGQVVAVAGATAGARRGTPPGLPEPAGETGGGPPRARGG